jgi:lysophospholipase L1-like esterase
MMTQNFNLLKKCLLLFFSILITLLIFDFFLRSLSPTNYKSWRKEFVSYNSLGYRDYEHQIKKKKDVFRILILGDSMVFGTWINKSEDTISGKLEKKLNQNLESPRFEVMNIAVSGHGTGDQTYRLLRSGLKFQPDLVILGYFHNDVPHVDDNFQKEYLNWGPKFLTKFDFLIGYLNKRSLLFKFLRDRIIDGVERAGLKNSYPDYLKFNYTTRGWDMGKVYLDILYRISQAKRFHFLIGNIPFINSLLDDTYPMLDANKKLKKFCAEREIPYIDFYEKGFKNKNPNDLMGRPGDFHFNEIGADLVASAINEYLTPLKKYKNITRFHNAFTLDEIRNNEWFIDLLDKKFNDLENNAHLVFDTSKKGNHITSLEINKVGQNYIFSRMWQKNNEENFFIKNTNLDINGRFISYEKKKFSRIEKNIVESEELKIDNVKSIWINKHYQNHQRKNDLVKTNKFAGYYNLETEKGALNIKLTKNVVFPDPITLEKNIFKKTTQEPLDPNSYNEFLDNIKKFANLNPELARNFIGNDLKTDLDWQNKFSLKELKEISQAFALFQYFMFFKVFGFETYLEKLHTAIIKRNVKKKYVLNALKQFYIATNNQDKFKKLLNYKKFTVSQAIQRN